MNVTPAMKTAPKDCYVFDIDGTLADLSHRLHHIEKKPKNWDAFFAESADDKAIAHICDLARHLSKVAPVVFVSGRSDRVRRDTEDCLEREGGGRSPLCVRKARDRRPEHRANAERL